MPVEGRSIVLVGPLAAGKTTVGRALAVQLGLPLCSLDDVRGPYLERAGYDGAAAARAFAAGRTVPDKLAYGRPFEVEVVERVMHDVPGAVIDFGASNSVHDDPALLARVAAAVSGSDVVLLLPSPDPVGSDVVLTDRLRELLGAKGETPSDELLELNAYFVRHPANRHLATEVVWTQGRAPADIAAEIAHRLGRSPRAGSGRG